MIEGNRISQLNNKVCCSFLQAQQTAKQYEENEALNADEFDPEAQAKIAERIKQANIEANWQAALEHSPEIFGEINMLYVVMEVSSSRLCFLLSDFYFLI